MRAPMVTATGAAAGGAGSVAATTEVGADDGPVWTALCVAIDVDAACVGDVLLRLSQERRGERPELAAVESAVLECIDVHRLDLAQRPLEALHGFNVLANALMTAPQELPGDATYVLVTIAGAFTARVVFELGS